MANRSEDLVAQMLSQVAGIGGGFAKSQTSGLGKAAGTAMQQTPSAINIGDQVAKKIAQSLGDYFSIKAVQAAEAGMPPEELINTVNKTVSNVQNPNQIQVSHPSMNQNSDPNQPNILMNATRNFDRAPINPGIPQPRQPQQSGQVAPQGQQDTESMLRNALGGAGSAVKSIAQFPMKALSTVFEPYTDYTINKSIGAKVKEAETVPMSKARREELNLSGAYELEKELLKSRGTNVIAQENKLSDDYNKMTEDFRTRSGSFQTLNDLVNSGANDGANDLAIAYEYIRLQDPNAVKEGELKNLKDAVPLLSKFGIKTGKLLNKSTMFDPDTRKKILQSASVKYNAMARQAQSLTDQYSKKIRQYGGDPERALINPTAPASQSGSKLGSELVTSGGNKYRRV